MANFQHLVTSGCSFTMSKTPKTPNGGKSWAYWLAESLDVQLHNTAMGSQGNDLIARKCIHKVNELLLSNIPPQEILVGIMWSGADRKDFYSSDVPADFPENESGWIKNPEQFVDGAQDQGGWVLMSGGWMHKYSKIWYEHFYDQVGAYINTYERIHWVQSYLKSVGVKYFMCTYMSNVINYMNECGPVRPPEYHECCKQDPNIKWMHDQVDWKCFLPVQSYSAWCDVNYADFINYYSHPHEHHSQQFVQKVVLPHIQENLLK